MLLLTRIAFRNLFRQKRRNVLLGAAYSVCAIVLIVAISFSKGITTTLIDRVVAYAAGHANVLFAYKGKPMSQMMRDGLVWKSRIEKIPGVVKVEPSMAVAARAIGNGRSGSVVLTAVNMHATFTREDSSQAEDNFPMSEGSWDALKDTTIENPLIISAAKAKYLNVGLGDAIRVRVQDFNGSFQAARLTVVGIFKPSNMFLDGSLFLELRDMARIMDMHSGDSPSLFLTIHDPRRNAVAVADSIWKIMDPAKAFFEGTISIRSSPLLNRSVSIGGLQLDSGSRREFAGLLVKTGSDVPNWPGEKKAFVSSRLSDSLMLKVGDTLTLGYPLRRPTQQTGGSGRANLVIGGLFNAPPGLPEELILIQGRAFIDRYEEAVPSLHEGTERDSSGFWEKTLISQWNLLPRARSAAEFGKQQRDLSQGKYQSTTVAVNTMYEAASNVLQLESVLNLITFGACLIAFLIILIGVVNTLRMTIRERTREIGTLRSIGMQRGDIRNIFVLEAGALALISSAIGTAIAFAIIGGLSVVTLEHAGNPLGVLLLKGHLVFEPSLGGVLFVNTLIVLISIVTAWFPANRAARVSPSDALRHH